MLRHKAERHERPALEHEEIARRVRLDRHDSAARSARVLDDLASNQLMDKECVGVLDRWAVEDAVSKLLGTLTGGDPLEEHEKAVLMRTGGEDRQRGLTTTNTTGENGARCQAFHSVAHESDDDLAF